MKSLALSFFVALAASPGVAQDELFGYADALQIELARDPRIHPDGERIAYVRRSVDLTRDRFVHRVWLVEADGTDHRPLADVEADHDLPRWSPEGDRLALVRYAGERIELSLVDPSQDEVRELVTLPSPPLSLTWSPDGRRLAFAMFVPLPSVAPVRAVPRPANAAWAPEAIVIDHHPYRDDGVDVRPPGAVQLHVVDVETAAIRARTSEPWDLYDPYDNQDPQWTSDGTTLLTSACPLPGRTYDSASRSLYAIDVETGAVTRLTTLPGTWTQPAGTSVDRRIVCVGCDAERGGFEQHHLFVFEDAFDEPRRIAPRLDRHVSRPRWASDGRSVYCCVEDEGVTRIARVWLDGTVTAIADSVGSSLMTPGASGSFTVARDGRIATVVTTPTRPSDVMVVDPDGSRILTDLNGPRLARRRLASTVRRRVVATGPDTPGLDMWVAYPPGVEAGRRTHPAILLIHGGPFSSFGNRFSATVQLFAAAGYVVVYGNPRGSSGYGEDFVSPIAYAFPGADAADLMRMVDALVATEPVDPSRLFVTGASYGGCLTASIVGETDRFRAASAVSPIINFTSHSLVSAYSGYFVHQWFRAMPWEAHGDYWSRSPLSRVGNVTTPTMLVCGDLDYDTPIVEIEQFYQALSLRGVAARMVRYPSAGHGSWRPTQTVSAVAETLRWFRMHDAPGSDRPD